MLSDRDVDVGSLTAEGISGVIESNCNKPLFDIIMDQIRIIYYLPSKFKWSEIKKAFDDDDTQYNLVILVVKEKVSQNNLKLIQGQGLNIQIFEIKELQFNISKHVLVPKHELVKDEQEVKSIVERYSIKSKYQLPHILKTDPMSRYLGLKSGDVVKITRTSPTAGEYIIYRCCL
jgi:DNA-directed RNA polymerase I, II, and III subunit RPABC1